MQSSAIVVIFMAAFASIVFAAPRPRVQVWTWNARLADNSTANATSSSTCLSHVGLHLQKSCRPTFLHPTSAYIHLPHTSCKNIKLFPEIKWTPHTPTPPPSTHSTSPISHVYLHTSNANLHPMSVYIQR